MSLRVAFRAVRPQHIVSSVSRPFSTTQPRKFDFNKYMDSVSSSETRAEIAAWQSQFMEMKSKALAESKKKPTIDWAYYEKTIMAQGLVAEYKKAVESIPELKFQTSVGENLERGFAELIKEAEKVGAESDAAIKELEGKLAELESNSDWANLEIEKALEADAELKAEIKKEIDEHKWFAL